MATIFENNSEVFVVYWEDIKQKKCVWLRKFFFQLSAIFKKPANVATILKNTSLRERSTDSKDFK